MSLAPRWSERLSKTGRPEQPLRAGSVVIRMTQTIARGITTDVRARGRYFSGFCWAMYRVTNSPKTADLSTSDKRELLEGFEEILALASYRRQQTEATHEDGMSGITGRSNASDRSLYNAEAIDLSSFTLLDNSPYAIRRFQSTLGHFHLKQGQGQFELSAAGRTLAERLDEVAGAYFEPIVAAIEEGTVPLTLLDELADAFSHQGCFTSKDNEGERDALQRMLLGVVSWNDQAQTVTLDDWPIRLDVPVREHYQYMVSDEHYTDNLRDAVCSEMHHLRRAWCLAILRAQQLLAATDTGAELAYDARDSERFGPIRPLGRIFFLQVQLTHALRAQLWGLAAHLEREAPEGVPRTELLNQLEATPIAAEAGAVRRTETTLGSERLDQSAIARELFVAGRVAPTAYDITVPDSAPGESEFETVADLRDWLQSTVVGRWRPTTDADVTGWTLIEATEAAFAAVEAATTRSEAIIALGRLLARSTVQLVAAVDQYQRLIEGRELLRRYVEQRFGDRHSSLVKTAQYIDSYGSDTALATLARRLLDERVITVHNTVVQDRLGSGSISLVFGVGADAGDHSTGNDSTLFAAGGTGRPGTATLRYRDLRRLMRDVGLLAYQPDSELWVPTDDGETVLARFRGEYE